MVDPEVVEEKINVIRDKLEELEDLELVNKLDLINLKNDLERIKLTSQVASPEMGERLVELERLASMLGGFKKLEDIMDEINNLRSEIQKLKPVETEKYVKQVEELRAALEKLPKGKVLPLKQMEELRKTIEVNEEKIRTLESIVKRAKPKVIKCPKCGSKLPSHAKFCGKCGEKV